MKLDFSTLEDMCISPVDNDSEGLITTLEESNDTHKLAIALLCGSSESGYSRLRHTVESFASLPSYYMLTKDRPKVSPVSYGISSSDNNIIEEGD